MKTVRAWLKRRDHEALSRAYWTYFPIDYLLLPDKSHTVQDLESRAQASMVRYIESLIALPEKEISPEEQHIFFANEHYSHDGREIIAEMCAVKDIFQQEEPERYGWMFMDWDTILDSWVADNPMTVDFIDVVLSHILHEMCFLGMDREEANQRKDEIRAELEERSGQPQEGIPAEEVFEELRKKYGFPERPKDPQADAIRSEIVRLEIEYTEHCRKREFALLREALAKEWRG